MADMAQPTKDPFTSAMTLSQMGIRSVPECYILPPTQRPTLDQTHSSFSALPVIDLCFLDNPALRSQVIEEVHVACKEFGVFQVINHGVPISLTDGALDVAADFFDMTNDKKMQLASTNVHEQKDIEQGSQVIAVNCYPACPEPNLALGLPRHSDYGLLTILLQNQQGLEVVDSNEKWHPVQVIKEALVVQLGDQMEVLSNGRYKSVVHRATVNSERKRLSIASLHSLAMNRNITPAPELVDERHPLSYKEGSFGDFLNFISDNDIRRSAPPWLLFHCRRSSASWASSASSPPLLTHNCLSSLSSNRRCNGRSFMSGNVDFMRGRKLIMRCGYFLWAGSAHTKAF